MTRAQVSLIGLGLLLIASLAAAQSPEPSAPAAPVAPSTQASDASPFAIAETVEVTATRGSINVDQSPASLSVVSRSEMERRNVRFLDQALTLVEGVAAYRARGVQDVEFGIGMRGFSARSSATQSRVLVLLDGQPLNNSYTGSVNWSSIPVGEVERVEIGRGPFSSLYGGNAMGGVINILTRPVDKRSIEANAQHGSQDTTSWSARYGERLFGRLGVSVGFDRLRTGGYPSQDALRTATASTAGAGTVVTGVVRYLTPTGGVNYSIGDRGDNWIETRGLRIRAEYAFGPKTFSSFQYIRQSSRYGWSPYHSTLRDPRGDTVDNGAVISLEDGAFKRIQVTPANYLSVSSSTSSNTYQAQVWRMMPRHSQLRLQAGLVQQPPDALSTPGVSATLGGGAGTVTTLANRGAYASALWSMAAEGRHNAIVGTDLRFDQASIAVAPVPDYLTLENPSPRDTYSAGRAVNQSVYGQDRILISDAVQLTAGVRYDFWKTFDGENQTAALQQVRKFPARASNSVTGKLGLNYRASEHTRVRASMGNAFRNPSVFELYRDARFSSGLQLLGNPDVNPERMTSWEAGVRQHLHAKADADVAYFENRIQDLIYRTTDFDRDSTGQTRLLTNAGEGRTRGLEAALTERPISWLTTRETYTFTDAIITRNTALPDTQGKQVPLVPRHSATVSVDASWRKWSASLATRYQSAMFTTDTNIDTTHGVPGSYDALLISDMSLGYQATRRLGVYFNCDNMLNDRPFTFYLSPGRTMLGGVRVHF